MGEVAFNLGDKIKRLRAERNLALKDVAASSGFSKALISRIEHNFVSPPIATLYRISKALNVRMRDFFEEEPISENLWIVRAKERKKACRDGSRYGYSYETLASHPGLNGFEPLLVTLYPEHRERLHFFSHPGWEFILVLKGHMKLHFGKREIILHPGDSIFFSAGVSHSGSCEGRGAVTALSIRLTRREESQ